MTYLFTQIFYISTRVASMVIFLCSVFIWAYLSFLIMLSTTFLSTIYNFPDYMLAFYRSMGFL